MGQLTPILLEDGTRIYIEATEGNGSSPEPASPTRDSDYPKRDGVFINPQARTPQSFQDIESTIRAYTTYTLRAFKSVAIAEVSEVTLKFGVNISSEAGIPYIANAKGGCNLEITVKCEFPKQP
jgi:hypothetical protein